MENEATPELTTTVIRDMADLLEVRSAWDTLYGQGNNNPFASWSWVCCWWEVFGRTHGVIRDRLNIYVHRDREGIVRGITPLVRTQTGLWPFAARKLRNAGSVPSAGPLTEIPPLLVWPNWESSVFLAISRTLVKQRLEFDWADISGIPLPCTSPTHVQALFKRPLCAEKSCYVVVLPETWPELKARLSRNMKENLRHCYNSLKRNNHRFHFELVRGRAASPDVLNEFFELHTARSMMPDAPYHPDHFSSTLHREFLRRLVEGPMAEDCLMVARLRVGNKTVASRLVLPANGELFLYYSGFDPAWRKYGVMSLLTAECIRWAIDLAGVQRVILSTGYDRAKACWKPEERIIAGIRVFSSALRGRILMGGLHQYLEWGWKPLRFLLNRPSMSAAQ